MQLGLQSTLAEGISRVATGKTLTTGEMVITAIIEAQNKLDEQEVPYEDRYLFITPSLYNMAQNVDNTKSRAVLEDFAGIVKVPQTRFYTEVALADGITNQGGGFSKGRQLRTLTS